MALQQKVVNINFAQGVNSKVDPYQLPMEQFITLQNVVFNKDGRIDKRFGYGRKPEVESSSYVTTYHNNLIALGNNVNVFSEGSSSWINKGPTQPMQLEKISIVKSAKSHPQADSVVSSLTTGDADNLVCTVYTETNGATTTYKYTVASYSTGENVINPTLIVPTSGTVQASPRVFLLGNNFVLVFPVLISATYHLQYIAINTVNLIAAAAASITATYKPDGFIAFDGVVTNNNLYLAWNASDLGGALRMTSMSSNLTIATEVSFSTQVANYVNLCADTISASPVVYVNYYNNTSNIGKTLAVNSGLSTVLSPTTLFTTDNVVNITGVVKDAGINTIYYEVSNTYSYNSVTTDYIKKITVTQGGTVGSASIIVRSVGLASKAALVAGEIYFLAAYQYSVSNVNQNTFFLLNENGSCVAKLAYGNGGGYVTLGLPGFTVLDNELSIPYVFQNLAKTEAGVISAETGINLATFILNSSNIITSEIADNMHLSGGFVWMYDGNTPVEHNFHLYPDNIKVSPNLSTGSMTPGDYAYQVIYSWVDNQGNVFNSTNSVPVELEILTAPASFTGDVSTGSAIIFNCSSTTNLQAGQKLSGVGIAANTYIVAILTSTQVQMSNNGSSLATGTTISPTSTNAVKIDIPTLRLTYKIASPVKMEVYRWSQAEQAYHQVTSYSSPTLNDVTVDSVTFVDTLADTTIIGNNLIYTTGGILPNAAAPATNIMTLYQNRLFCVNAENPNSLVFSKQVIERVPVEFTNEFTLYIAPTIGAEGSTGDITALAAMDDKIIIFKENAIYYLVGIGPDNLGQNFDFSEATFITGTVGCTNQQSIVMTKDGLMFQSNKGIWMLGRNLQTVYIGASVEAYNQYAVNSAQVIPGTNQVRFTLSNSITLMYDYFFNRWATHTNQGAVSSTLYQGLHTYINTFGQIYQETPDVYLDGSTPVTTLVTFAPINLAGLQGYQRVYEVGIIGTYYTPHKLGVEIAYNYSPYPEQQEIITPTNYSPYYGQDLFYGSGSPYGGNPQLETWRVFTSKQLCTAVQITIREIYDPTYNVPAGAGLTISGLSLTIGVKKGSVPGQRNSV